MVHKPKNTFTVTIGEALDRYSILLLKRKYAHEDIVDGKRWDGQTIDLVALDAEIHKVEEELSHYISVPVVTAVIKLAQANAMIWQSERGLRTGDLKSIDLAKAGLESVRIRQENAVRVSSKKELTQVLGDIDGV